MSHVTYKIVEHDGGWAYQVEGSYSETFASRDAALGAARRAAGEQRVSGDTHGIIYEPRARCERNSPTAMTGRRPT